LLVHSAVLSAVLGVVLCRGRHGRRLGRHLLPCACPSIMRFDSFGELGAIECVAVGCMLIVGRSAGLHF
jgi:hypothetical protein